MKLFRKKNKDKLVLQITVLDLLMQQLPDEMKKSKNKYTYTYSPLGQMLSIYEILDEEEDKT